MKLTVSHLRPNRRRRITLIKRQRPSDAPAAAVPNASVPELLRDPKLMDRIADAMKAEGYAGDVRPALLAYIALTSRHLGRPINLVYVAQSATGKNRAVDAARSLHPEEAYVLIRAGSACAVIYSEEDYAHRVVIFGEADSIPDEGAAASAIRSLAADNAMEYDVVERAPKTNQFRNRHIVKPGPTGLITTSTRSLGRQLGTRLLEVSLLDDPAQTRAIMRMQARAAMGAAKPLNDREAFLDAQRWLAEHGAHEVVVPFADLLAKRLPALVVRMRRDFLQLLACIEAVALLHQCQRGLDANGAVVATFVDYRIARDLLESVFASTNAEGLTPGMRRAVEAVRPGETLTVSALAARLEIGKSSADYHVARAIKRGWLENRETRKGHGAKIALGAPLPDTNNCLPTVESLEEVFECSSRSGPDRVTGDIRTIQAPKKKMFWFSPR